MSTGLLNEGCWAFPTTTSKVKALFTILKDVKNKSPKYVADSKVDPEAVQAALHNIFGDDDLFDSLNDSFTAEGVIFDVRDRLKEILGSKNTDIPGLQKPAMDALRKFASSGNIVEKKIVEATSTDKVTFTVDDDKLDNKLHDMFKDKLDYKDDRGDSWYILDKKDFDRFIDYADSAGYDVDYDNSADSVIELGTTLDEENSTGNVAGFNTPQAFAKKGEKGNRGIDAMNSLGYTVMSRKGKSQVNPVNETIEKNWKKGDILASGQQIVKFIKYNKAGDEYGGEDTFTGIRLKSKYPEDRESIGHEFPDGYIVAFKKTDPNNPKYLKESLNEIAYKDYKNLDMPNSKKVNLAINDVATSLYQIENFMKQNAKLMKEEGMGTDKYWRSTVQKVLKISERIGNIKKQLKEFGIKELADKGRQDKIDFIVACSTELPKKHQWRAQDLAQLPDSKLEVVLKNRLNMHECDAMAKTYGFKKGGVKEVHVDGLPDAIKKKVKEVVIPEGQSELGLDSSNDIKSIFEKFKKLSNVQIKKTNEGKRYKYQYGSSYLTFASDKNDNPIEAYFDEDRATDFISKMKDLGFGPNIFGRLSKLGTESIKGYTTIIKFKLK